MALSEEEKATLEALTRKANEPDDNESDFDVEWWEEGTDGTRRGGRMPWKQGKGVYGKYFPDLFGETPPEGGKEGGTGDSQKKEGVAQQYFGRKRNSGQE